jgi:hypothetical protein
MGKRKRESPPRGKRSSKKRARRIRQAESQSPVILLLALAHVLNECEKAGIRPKLKHGILFTDAGYVLPAKDNRWAARPLKNH